MPLDLQAEAILLSDIGLFRFGKTNEQSDIRSRNRNHSSYDENSNKKRELKKESATRFGKIFV